MAETITAAEANRLFSAMLRRVRGGKTVTVTSHGRPVARIVPFDLEERVGSAARRALFERLRAAPLMKLKTPAWTRAELHARERRG